MDNQNVNSLLTGLTSSLDKYLGVNIANQIEQRNAEAKSARELQNSKTLETHKSGLQREEEALKAFINGEIDGETAKAVNPKYAAIVEGYFEKNGRYPSPETATKLFKEATDTTNQSNQKELNRENRIAQQVTAYSEKLRTNKIIMDSKKAGISAGQVDEMARLAKEGNTVAAAGMAARMARTMGEVGVLTDTDLTRYVESGKLDRKIADKVSRMLKGKPTDLTIDEIQQVANVMKSSYKMKVQDEIDSYVNTLAVNYKMPVEEAAERLDVTYGGTKQGKRKDETTTAGESSAKPAPAGKSFLKPGEEAEYEEFKRQMLGGK